VADFQQLNWKRTLSTSLCEWDLLQNFNQNQTSACYLVCTKRL